jgi:hypothetical protein
VFTVISFHARTAVAPADDPTAAAGGARIVATATGAAKTATELRLASSRFIVGSFRGGGARHDLFRPPTQQWRSMPGCIRRSCSALDPMSSNTTFCVYPGRPQAATLRRSGRKAQDLNA